MKPACCITALLLFGATAFARIGETEAQIEKRYGQPRAGSRSTRAYSYKDFFIIVTFDNGVSGIETFQKRNASPISDAEIGKLLEANGREAKWHKTAQNDFEIRYEQRTWFAEYNAVTNTLTIADSGALNRINAHNQTRDGKRM